jgi:hypothetical protein
MVMPFQVEVTNAMWLYRDLFKNRDATGIALLMVASWLFNRMGERVRGTGVIFDPIEAMQDAYEITQNKKLGTGEKAVRVAGRFGGEVLSNVPLGQNIAGSLYPEYGFNLYGAKMPTRKEFFGSEDPTRYGVGILATDAIKDPLFKLLPRFGGYQAEKTIKGINAIENRGVYENNVLGEILTDRGKKRYPVAPTLPNKARALLFGPGGLPETQKYYDKKK